MLFRSQSPLEGHRRIVCRQQRIQQRAVFGGLNVDGDILEIFSRGAFSRRVPLAWLAVQVQPSIKGRLVVRIASARDDMPLYEVMQKARITPGNAVPGSYSFSGMLGISQRVERSWPVQDVNRCP